MAMPVTRTASCLLIAAGLAALGGCQILDPDRGVMRDRSVAPITEPKEVAAVRPAKPIADAPLTEPLNVVVQNGFGSVVVRENPDEDRPQVKVRRMDDAAAKGPSDGFTAVLTDGTLNIDCPDQGGPVNVEIVVHSLANVTVRNSGGIVSIQNASGSIDVTNGTAERAGDAITVNTRHQLSSAISLGTDRGPVTLSMPSGSAGLLNVRGQPMRVNVYARNENLSQVRLGEGTYSAVANGGSAEMRISAPGPVTVTFR